MRLRKMKKQPLPRRPADIEAEHGDRYVEESWTTGELEVIDLRASSGFGMRSRGWLNAHVAPAQKRGAKPVCVDGVWYWRYD